ncbi:hypothetical protein ACQKDS_14725 [Serratia sp. NPDC078593]|uniref:hypothetical protein n=1 Tax=unclassified Serratia (in: enterobacteria) TaxID=2647522 RepID=UPI0037D5A8B8
MNIAFSWRTMVIGVLLVALIAAGRLASYYHDNYQESQRQVAEQKKTLAQQSGLISTLQDQDRKNRALAAEQQQREQQLRQQGETYQRKYRDAIKNDNCAKRDAPGSVIDILRGTDTTAAGAHSSVTP